jgi:glycosyltransferase involved in cell wall biosynthesis
MACLEIALATYNGAPYLSELMDSLFAQSWQDFNIVVADDNSDDDTLNILGRFQTLHPGRIQVVGFPEQSGSAVANFSRLATHLSADYICFADQDDVWLPDKLTASLKRMRSAEALYGSDCPILVHTDLELTDEKLERRHRSFWKHVSINPRRRTLREMLIEISVAGCTMMANRSLYELARPIPPEAVMHDHWLALVASAFGQIEFDPEPSLLYRRHDASVSAHPDAGVAWLFQRTSEVVFGLTTGRDRREFDRLTMQAAAFLERYGTRLAEDQRRLLAIFTGITTVGRARGCSNLLQYGILRTSLVRNLALFFLLCRTRKHVGGGEKLTPEAPARVDGSCPTDKRG